MRRRDAEGRFVVERDEKDTITLKADWVVEAIGQSPDMNWKSVEGADIFFAGDISSNKCSVVDAMASGRDTAIAVDAALRGREVKNPMDGNILHTADINERIYPYNRIKNIRPEGWHNWQKEREQTARYMEYNNRGEGAATDQRVTWSRQLTKKEAQKITLQEVFTVNDTWQP